MVKKLITIAVCLLMFGMLGFIGTAKAAGNDVVFSADTPIGDGTTHSDMVVAALSQVETFAVGDSDVTITLASGSDITFKSASGKIMSVDCSAGATFTAAFPSAMRVVYHASCTTVVVTIGAGTLTEANVAASPLTAATASAYTVTFKTVNSLNSGDKIRLDFGGGFTVADSTDATKVTTLTDDTTSITTGISLASVAATKRVTITLASAVSAKSVLNIVLSSTLVTNPATASADTAISGIDIYTTTSGGTTIDSKLDQTAFNRVIDLVPGWNVFAPSQALEVPAYATVLTPISGSYSAIYTLVWDSVTSSMTWQTPTTIDPLYGYAIYITGSATKKLPLDFAKETGTNGLFERSLAHKGWYITGYAGTSASKVAQTLGNCLDGLVRNDANDTYKFSSIVDLTGTAAGGTPTSHAIVSATISEAAGGSTMKFARDFGYAVYTTSDSLVLKGDRGL